MKGMRAVVMLPTYNERENIELIVPAILKQGKNLKIVIVDDNSPDGTGKVVDGLAKKYRNKIHVIHRKEKGRGTAGIAGFKYALKTGADCIIEMDADYSHNPDDIPRFLKAIKDYDIVIGSRYIKGGRMVNCRLIPSLLSRVANNFNSLLFGLKIRDTSGGYKCYRRYVLENIELDNFISTEYSVGIEILFKAIIKGYSFIEIPIIFVNRIRGNAKSNWNIRFNYLFTILRLRLKR